MIITKFETREVKDSKDNRIMFIEICPVKNNQHLATFIPNEYRGVTIDDAKKLAERFCELLNTFGVE